jgi:hypothetical protein
MTDFKVVDVPGMLAVKSTISDGKGQWLPDTDWNREAAESQFVLAEVLAENSLLQASARRVERRPDLVIHWSDLNEIGQEFVRADYDKWMRSIDRTGMSEQEKRSKLLKRWEKFRASRTHA